jgi:hypothetical protein
LPTSPTTALLAVLSLTLGAGVATSRRTEQFTVLVCVLAAGQLLGHLLLGIDGHTHHPAATAPWSTMLAAHVTAVAVGAALITIGGRLCAAISRVLLAVAPRLRLPVAAPAAVVLRSADQPLQSARLLRTSLSHRGPPVVFAP